MGGGWQGRGECRCEGESWLFLSVDSPNCRHLGARALYSRQAGSSQMCALRFVGVAIEASERRPALILWGTGTVSEGSLSQRCHTKSRPHHYIIVCIEITLKLVCASPLAKCSYGLGRILDRDVVIAQAVRREASLLCVVHHNRSARRHRSSALPSPMPVRTGHVNIELVRGDNLVDLDEEKGGKGSDPYCVFLCGKSEANT